MERKTNIFKDGIISKIIRYLIILFRRFYIYVTFFNKKILYPHPTIKIDIVIPVIDRDFDIFIICFFKLKKHIKNKIDNIYIVSNSEKIKKYCQINDLKYIDENKILSNYSDLINLFNTNRIGWLKQQLIKLHGNYGNNDNYLVIDSDHILLSDHIFITNDNKFNFYISSGFHNPYYIIIKKLLNIKLNHFSYITHKMIINKRILNNLKLDIENYTSKRWDLAIIQNINFKEKSFFSEFELYGNYVSSNIKSHVLWNNKDFSRTNFNLNTINNSNNKFSSITFSYYL